jgi:general secretion pathway protein G
MSSTQASHHGPEARGSSRPSRGDRSTRGRGTRSAGTRADGFTLLELLVVVAIIALLAAYVGPRFFGQVGASKQTVAKAQIESFGRALQVFHANVGRFPSTQEGLQALVTAPAGADRWNGPYLEKTVPMDPWGRAYDYRAPSAQADFQITSLGADGQPGGSGEAADITGP